jgi:tRNA dimethylallyltransferase
LSQPPLVTLIAGPTASGKSALALKMARETGAVIINADSQQLYADLRILTARPSVEEEAQADHRLYGVADAADAWSVGRWSRAAIELLAALEAEDRPAILVGGTGLYFTALTKGLADIPTVPTNVRNAVEADFVEKGEVTFRDALAGVDPKAASTIEKGDRQRLVRAMSVYVSSGRAISDWQADTLPLLKSGVWTGIVIEPDRQRLYEKCDRRVDTMLENNVLDEVRTLIARQLPSSLPAMKAVGIRELAACLMGEETQGDAVASLKRATRNYAKRQLTWFRNQAPFWNRIRN